MEEEEVEKVEDDEEALKVFEKLFIWIYAAYIVYKIWIIYINYIGSIYIENRS